MFLAFLYGALHGLIAWIKLATETHTHADFTIVDDHESCHLHNNL